MERASPRCSWRASIAVLEARSELTRGIIAIWRGQVWSRLHGTRRHGGERVVSALIQGHMLTSTVRGVVGSVTVL